MHIVEASCLFLLSDFFNYFSIRFRWVHSGFHISVEVARPFLIFGLHFQGHKQRCGASIGGGCIFLIDIARCGSLSSSIAGSEEMGRTVKNWMFPV